MCWGAVNARDVPIPKFLPMPILVEMPIPKKLPILADADSIGTSLQ